MKQQNIRRNEEGQIVLTTTDEQVIDDDAAKEQLKSLYTQRDTIQKQISAIEALQARLDNILQAIFALESVGITTGKVQQVMPNIGVLVGNGGATPSEPSILDVQSRP